MLSLFLLHQIVTCHVAVVINCNLCDKKIVEEKKVATEL